MTSDERWEKVKAYYEGCYKDARGIKIKFRKRLTEEQIDMLYNKMVQLPNDLESAPSRKLLKFSNVVRLLRTQDVEKI